MSTDKRSTLRLTPGQWFFGIVALTSPFLLYAICLLQPTFDDWTYTTYPNSDPEWWKFLLPYGYYWRPFDGLYGYVVALGENLFPWLNHAVIYAGHVAGVALVWLLAHELGFRPAARVVAACFYWLSPAVLGNILTLDTLNQTYAATFGLAALLLYLRGGRHATAWWIGLSMVAALWKENGLMWLFVCPLLGWAFGRKTRGEALHHLLWGTAIFAAYWCVRLALPNTYEHATNDYMQSSIGYKLRNLSKYVVLTYVSADFVSLFHRPSRCLPLLIATAALWLPLFLCLCHRLWQERRDIRPWALLAASLLLAAPHLWTKFATMHAYAGLAPVALLTGWLCPREGKPTRGFIACFALYLVSAVTVDVRHWQKAYASGMTGQRMAAMTVSRTHKPTHRVFCFCIDNGEEKYSSFCVIPYDAFGWGNAVIWMNRGRWPQRLDNATISATEARNIRRLTAQKLRQGYDHVWIVNGTQVTVVER